MPVLVGFFDRAEACIHQTVSFGFDICVHSPLWLMAFRHESFVKNLFVYSVTVYLTCRQWVLLTEFPLGYVRGERVHLRYGTNYVSEETIFKILRCFISEVVISKIPF